MECTFMAKPHSGNKLDLDEDHLLPVIEWLSSNKKILLISFFSLIVILIIGVRVAAAWSSGNEVDFFRADVAFNQFENAKSLDAQVAALEELTGIMKHHPELGAKFDGPLAQTFFLENETLKGESFITPIFARTKSEHFTLYQDYTKTSVAIGLKQYPEAVEQTKQLAAVLKQLHSEENILLEVFTLVRLAMLYEQTGESASERGAWEEMQNDPRLSSALAQAMQTEEISLVHYMEERIRALQAATTS